VHLGSLEGHGDEKGANFGVDRGTRESMRARSRERYACPIPGVGQHRVLVRHGAKLPVRDFGLHINESAALGGKRLRDGEGLDVPDGMSSRTELAGN
jgi:hypothetical protein